MLRHVVRTVLALIPVAGFAAAGPVASSRNMQQILWQGALPAPQPAPASADAFPSPAAAFDTRAFPEPAPQPAAHPDAPILPVVTGALVDLPDASASRDNPFGLGAGLRHYFDDRTDALTPYIGLDAGVKQLPGDPAREDSPFSVYAWQPSVGLRAGVTYPVSTGFDLGIASGFYYQSSTLTPGGRRGQDDAAPYDSGAEGFVMPISVRGRVRF